MMKILVFWLIVVANISDNGKASLDSFVPANTNVLFEDITKSSDSSCYRPCKFNVKPRRCHFKFRIAPTIDDDDKVMLSINNQVPGPAINVCVNDIVVVEVQNKVPDQSLAIHWHGVEQKGTPYMDGVPMVTQCPIEYGSTYKYAFRASAPGTFFYHADSVSHQSDGVLGALVVNQPQPLEPHSSLYDYDRSTENTLLVSASFPELLTGSLEDLNTIRPTALHVNGDMDISKVYVMEGFGYRFRVINGVGIECPIIFHIEQHEVTAITTDSRPVKPATASALLLYPGERMDVVVRANQKPGGYWIHVVGQGGACAGLRATAMLLYSGFNYTSMLVQTQKEKHKQLEVKEDSLLQGQKLESLIDFARVDQIKSFYLGIDRNIIRFKDTDNDFRYISDAIPKKPFFPAYLSLQENGVVQINGKSFLYPNAPFLLRPRDVKPDLICQVGKEEEQKDLQCVQVLNVPDNDVLELSLVNEGFGSNDSYTFHLHGYSMQVLATWENPERSPISREHFQQMDRDGKIKRNIRNPPLKDTVTVPNKGFVIVRIKPEYAGAWMFECRSCGVSSLPAALIVSAAQPLPKSVMDSLPRCGSYRPPDVLLN